MNKVQKVIEDYTPKKIEMQAYEATFEVMRNAIGSITAIPKKEDHTEAETLFFETIKRFN